MTSTKLYNSGTQLVLNDTTLVFETSSLKYSTPSHVLLNISSHLKTNHQFSLHHVLILSRLPLTEEVAVVVVVVVVAIVDTVHHLT